MDEVDVRIEAWSSCQKLCWRESNVNARAELTVHERSRGWRSVSVSFERPQYQSAINSNYELANGLFISNPVIISRGGQILEWNYLVVFLPRIYATKLQLFL